MLCQGAELYGNNASGFDRVTSGSVRKIVYFVHQQSVILVLVSISIY